MSKNKFFRKLLIGGLCALTATAMIGATACNKDGDDKKKPEPKPPVVTTDEYTVTFNLDGGTWSHDDGYSIKVDAGEKLPSTANLGGQPTKTGYDFKGWWSGNTEYVPGIAPISANTTLTAKWELQEQEDPAQFKLATEVNVTDTFTDKTQETVAAGTLIGVESGIYVVSESKLSPSTTNIKYTLNGKEETISAATRLQLKGQSKIEGSETKTITNALKFEVNDNAKIIIYAVSASGAEVRSLALYDLNLETPLVNTQAIDNSTVTTAIFEVEEGGTYYVGCPINGINIYYMAVTYSDINESTAKTVDKEDATCTKAGNIAYTVTNFGRIKNSENEVIVNSATVIPATGHTYTDAEITVTTTPTAEEGGTGTATLSCDTCETPATITLPELTSDKYTTSEEGAASGNYIYSYYDNATKRTVTFEAVKVTPVQTVTYTATCNGKTIVSSDATAFDASQIVVSTAKTGITVEYDGTTYSTGAKLDGSGTVTINLTKDSEVTFYIFSSNGASYAGLNVTEDGAAVDNTNISVVTLDAGANVYSVTYKLKAGKEYIIKRGGTKETALLKMDFTQVVEAAE